MDPASETPTLPIVEAESLTKLYGVVIGVNDITLSLAPGVHGLLGPNGAGKSTLLKLLTGQLRPSEGAVRVLGENPWNNPRVFKRIGYCHEYDAFYDHLTGVEFVTNLARLSGLNRGWAAEQARVALARVGAAGFMNRKIGTYSKGMRQRVKVAQAIAHNPDLLILDEPLSGTDPVGRREIIDLIVRLGEEGKSVLVSSHVLHEVQAMTQNFLLIFNGRVLASGSVREVRALIDKHPHRITLRCDRPREVASRLLVELPVTGIELDETRGELSLLTSDPETFYADFPEVVRGCGATVHALISQDDNLQAVFNYLVGGA